MPGPLTSTASATGPAVQASPQPHVQDLGNTGAAADEPGAVGDPAMQLGGLPGNLPVFCQKEATKPSRSLPDLIQMVFSYWKNIPLKKNNNNSD